MEIVDSIIYFIETDQEFSRNGLIALAEFIEDCEFDILKTRILNILGKHGGKITLPSQLVRLIYNRIILENAVIRASALSALGEIAYEIQDPQLKKNIISLIHGCLNDADQEVRERAYFYCKALNQESTQLESFIFKTNNEINIDLLEQLILTQKDDLLNNDNIIEEISSTLSNPEKMSKILSMNQVNFQGKDTHDETSGAKDKHKASSGTHKKDKTTEKPIENEEFFKTHFSKVYGQPKLKSKQQVN